jgi:hypothetical protein
MRLDSSGRLGLGNSSPSERLDLGGGVSDTVKIRFSMGGNVGEIGSVGSGVANGLGNLTFFTRNGSTAVAAMTIDGSQRVGIGTATPGAKLVIDGGTSGDQLRLGTDPHYYRVGRNSSSGPLEFYGTQSGVTGYVFGGVDGERARIDSSGRLLVGTSTSAPDGSAQIQLVNSAPVLQVHRNANDASQATLVLSKARGSSNQIVQSGDIIGNVNFQAADGSNVYLLNAALISAQVDGTPGANDMPGRLVFSTTADGASSPTERMRINSNGAVGTFTADGVTSLNVSTAATAGTATIAAAIRYGATAVYGGTISLQIYSNGNVQNTNNSYGAISDVKLKENIVDANSQWDDLKALQVRNYNLKEGQTHTQIGLVAQEAELVSPGLVSESPDRDEEGNDLGTVTKSVNYSVLYMKAVKALQEAMERIEVLEQRLSDAGIA